MTNIKSQMKRNLQNNKRRTRNRFFRGMARAYVKHARGAIEESNLDEARQMTLQAVSALDKAAEKGILHKNNAARRKSRLIKRLHELEKQINPQSS